MLEQFGIPTINSLSHDGIFLYFTTIFVLILYGLGIFASTFINVILGLFGGGSISRLGLLSGLCWSQNEMGRFLFLSFQFLFCFVLLWVVCITKKSSDGLVEFSC